jgi:hypothetical protein
MFFIIEELKMKKRILLWAALGVFISTGSNTYASSNYDDLDNLINDMEDLSKIDFNETYVPILEDVIIQQAKRSREDMEIAATIDDGEPTRPDESENSKKIKFKPLVAGLYFKNSVSKEDDQCGFIYKRSLNNEERHDFEKPLEEETMRKKAKKARVSRENIDCFLQSGKQYVASAMELKTTGISIENVKTSADVQLLIANTLSIARLYSQASWNLVAANAYLDEEYCDQLQEINYNRGLVFDYNVSTLMALYKCCTTILVLGDNFGNDNLLHSTLGGLIKTASSVLQINSSKPHIAKAELRQEENELVKTIEKMFADILRLIDNKVIKSENCVEAAFDINAFLENLKIFKTDFDSIGRK